VANSAEYTGRSGAGHGSRVDPVGLRDTGSTRLRVESIVKKIHVREPAKKRPRRNGASSIPYHSAFSLPRDRGRAQGGPIAYTRSMKKGPTERSRDSRSPQPTGSQCISKAARQDEVLCEAQGLDLPTSPQRLKPSSRGGSATVPRIGGNVVRGPATADVPAPRPSCSVVAP
jgi:hypothetical protein